LPPEAAVLKLVLAPPAVADPVPPDVTANGVARVKTDLWFSASTTLVPLLYNHIAVAAGTEIPAPPDAKNCNSLCTIVINKIRFFNRWDCTVPN